MSISSPTAVRKVSTRCTIARTWAALGTGGSASETLSLIAVKPFATFAWASSTSEAVSRPNTQV